MLALAVAMGAACSRGSGASRSEMPLVGPTSAGTYFTASALSADRVAPRLGATLVTVVLTALHAGATAPASGGSRTHSALNVVERPGRWVAACPGGGGARIELPENLPFIGQVSLERVTTVWTACALDVEGTTITAGGTTTLNGTWSTSASSSPIQMQGPLDVGDIGPLPIDLQVDAATGSFNGQIGAIPVGAVVDGPFIPRPSPTPPAQPADAFTVTPPNANLGQLNLCRGGDTARATYTVTAAPDVTWTVALATEFDPGTYRVSVTPMRGTGSGTVTIVLTVVPFPPHVVCQPDTTETTSGDVLRFTPSRGAPVTVAGTLTETFPAAK